MTTIVTLQLEPLYAAEAKRRMSAGGGDKKSNEYQKSGLPKLADPINTRDKVA